MLHASFPFSILQYVRNSLVYTLHKIMFRLEWRNGFFFAHERVILVFFSSCAAVGEMNTMIPLEWTHEFVTRVHNLFLAQNNEPTNDEKRRSMNTVPVSLARYTFCWWRHNRLLIAFQWPDYYETRTWKVPSISLDIDFIHGEIHGCSCKKCNLHTWTCSEPNTLMYNHYRFRCMYRVCYVVY